VFHADAGIVDREAQRRASAEPLVEERSIRHGRARGNSPLGNPNVDGTASHYAERHRKRRKGSTVFGNEKSRRQDKE
jgi:hypothetical protein